MLRFILIAVLLSPLLTTSLLARPVPTEEPRRQTVVRTARGGKLVPQGSQFVPVANETTYFGGTVWAADSLRWEAIPDSMWTFDTGVGSSIKGPGTVDPEVNPHKMEGLHARMEGWVGFDVGFSDEAKLRRVADDDPRWEGDVCVGSTGGLGGMYSFWAGLFPEEARNLCFLTGQGYGNSWSICLVQTFAYSGGDATLLYDYVVDTEDGFDEFRVVVFDPITETEEWARRLDGQEAGRDSLILRSGFELPADPGDVEIRFCFLSDGAWSDADGLYPTDCGAFAVDNIQITGGITHSADFETDDDGWTVLDPQIWAGDWSNLVHLDDLPAPLVSEPCSIQDSVLVFFEPGYRHDELKDNVALTPWIDLERAGVMDRPARFIEYEGYAELSLLNYIFVQVRAQWFPDTCTVTGMVTNSPLTSLSSVFEFGSLPVCIDPSTSTQGRHNLSTLIPSHATEVRIGLGVISFCRFFANCTQITNSTPWLDNIRFGVHTMNPIQAAIDAASPGDTVWVPPGEYYGPGNRDLNFHGKNLVLMGAGDSTTVVDCQRLGRGLIFESGEDSTSIVEGLTIKNATAPELPNDVLDDGGVILIKNGSSPTIRHCTLTNGSAGAGGGIFVDFGAAVQVDGCIIRSNLARPGMGGGIGARGTVFVKNSELSSNTSYGYGGGIGAQGFLRVEDTQIIRNSSRDNIPGGSNFSPGGGVYTNGGTFTRCTISANQALHGAGILAMDSSGSLEFTECLITRNVAEEEGGGVKVELGSVTFRNCTFSVNFASWGGGAYLNPGTSAHFFNTILWDDCAEFEGNEIYHETANCVSHFVCSTFDLADLGGEGQFNCDGPQVFEDPLFCEPGECSQYSWGNVLGDFRLSTVSPCLPANSPCGELIGAVGITCNGDTVVVEPPAGPSTPAITACPNPFTTEVRLDFVSSPEIQPTIQVFDLQGRLVRTFKPSESAGFVNWDGCDEERRRRASGVYFIRLTAGPVQELRRVVLLP